jgi:type II secretory pathway component PulM
VLEKNMTEVIPSPKAERSVRDERDHLLIATGVLLVLSGLWLGYFIGHQQGMSVIGASISDLKKLNTKIDQQQAALDTMTRTLSSTVQERDIALTTSKDLKDSLEKQSADNAVLDARFKIYRDHLLSVGGMGLALQNVEIIPVSQSVFEYHIDLMQLRQKTTASVGTLSVRLIQGTNVVNIPLTSSRVSISDFQSLTGRWTMPTGFTPEFLEVNATAGGQSVVQRFAWERGALQESTPRASTPNPE